MKQEFASTWEYQTSGTTDAEGFGSATIPLYIDQAGHTYQVVALISPSGGGADPDLPSELSELALVGLVNVGALRGSNQLSFDVVSSFIL
jgi:hypothetical protein